MTAFNASLFKQQFPLLSRQINSKPLVYFDNAATTQKPQVVIDQTLKYYEQCNANVHRASHALSQNSTALFEQAREQVKQFIHARSSKEVIWTKGSTESINLVAQSWARNELNAGDEIAISVAEHHANIVPWQIVAEQVGAKIITLPLDEDGTISINQANELITEKTKLVAISHISNVIGKVNPIEKIIQKANQVGAKTLIDGAQAIAHMQVDVQALGCDFYVFSGHKMYGPTGIGVLYGKQTLLEHMPPYQAGGEMISTVSFEGTRFNDLPFKFEAGTPNMAGVIGLGKAIAFLSQYNDSEVGSKSHYERSLIHYCYQQLSTIKDVKFIVKKQPDVGIFSFKIAGHHNHDIASYLDAHGIAIRSGHHCAMPLMSYLKLDGCIRWSITAYNTTDEVDFAIQALKNYLKGEKVVAPNSTSDSQAIAEQFKRAKSWDSKHREIMLSSKKLTRMPVQLRTGESLINGCESSAWLSYSVNQAGEYHFSADSEAKVIRGLLYIVLAKYNGLTLSQIEDVNIDDYFTQLGLMQHLSPSRGNGLIAIVNKIKSIASQGV